MARAPHKLTRIAPVISLAPPAAGILEASLIRESTDMSRHDVVEQPFLRFPAFSNRAPDFTDSFRQ